MTRVCVDLAVLHLQSDWNVVLIRWNDYLGRKNASGSSATSSVRHVADRGGNPLPIAAAGPDPAGGSNITFGLSYLVMRETLSATAFGVCCGVLSAVNAGVADSSTARRFPLSLRIPADLPSSPTWLVSSPWRSARKRRPVPHPVARFCSDDIGVALIALLGIGGINVFLGNGEHAGWLSPLMLGVIAAAVVALVRFVVVQSSA